VSELKGPTRVILKNDDFPIPRYSFDRTAHLKDACFDAGIQTFKKNFANALTLLHPLRGLKIFIWAKMRVPETELVAEREAPEISAGYATGQSCSHPISEETRWLRFWSSM